MSTHGERVQAAVDEQREVLAAADRLEAALDPDKRQGWSRLSTDYTLLANGVAVARFSEVTDFRNVIAYLRKAVRLDTSEPADPPPAWDVPFSATAAVEGWESDDGRIAAHGSLVWDETRLPLPLLRAGSIGNPDQPVVGQVDRITRVGDAIRIHGVWAPQEVKGISVSVDQVTLDPTAPDGVQRFLEGRIRAFMVDPNPLWPDRCKVDEVQPPAAPLPQYPRTITPAEAARIAALNEEAERHG